MEAAILWLLIWGVLALSLPALIAYGFMFVGMLLADEVGAATGFVSGWVVGVAWFIFAAWRAILEIITLVQLLF